LDGRIALRNMTKGEHEKLDSIIGEFFDADSYARYLRGMAAFREGVEHRLSLADFPGGFGRWWPNTILPQLKRDLTDLGQQTSYAPVNFDIPEDTISLLGVLYVLEGSSLGARLLARRAAAIGYSADFGARHLAAQTSRPDAWTALVRLLSDIKPADNDKAIEAARKTFLAAIDAFTRDAEHERQS
jgi:heme oxygenase (biliverdin-IX-beta and delta-forming)